MNRTAYICREYIENPHITQRELSAKLSLSLGLVNRAVAQAVKAGYLIKEDKKYKVSTEGLTFLNAFKVDNAVITAAGFGSRFVPLTYDTPKGLLKVFGEPMVERQIKQLHSAGIYDITIVVGYLKEKFDYLQDKYKVKLLYNPEYTTKNTLATLWHARDLFYGRNTYLLASDNWLRANMYHSYEPGAWYSCSYIPEKTGEWCLRINKKGYIDKIEVGGEASYVMYGPAYLSREFSEVFIPEIEKYYNRSGTEDYYWEQAVADMINYPERFSAELPPLFANKQPAQQVYELENLEELRHFDTAYKTSSDNLALKLISEAFKIAESEINDIRCLKAGMTNNSFLFSVKGIHYICRIPGIGTEVLINRRQEYEVYKAIEVLKLSDEIVYIDSSNGYKISKYYENSRNADAFNPEDMKKCMQVLRQLHNSGIKVGHRFDIEAKIEYYESLCKDGSDMIFEDYDKVKAEMCRLLSKLKGLDRPLALVHADSIADNFIFISQTARRPDKACQPEINEDLSLLPKLIDWEYAGMGDPLMDIAMCCIYSYYSREESDFLLDTYLERQAEAEERDILYAYMALGGFLWSIWTVYKTKHGEFFGEYSLKMYRYAKDYYALLKERQFIS